MVTLALKLLRSLIVRVKVEVEVKVKMKTMYRLALKVHDCDIKHCWSGKT